VSTTTFGLLGMSDPCLKPTISIFSLIVASLPDSYPYFQGMLDIRAIILNVIDGKPLDMLGLLALSYRKFF